MRCAEVLAQPCGSRYELHVCGRAGGATTCRMHSRSSTRSATGRSQTAGFAAALNNINIVRNERRKELAFENKVW